MFYLNPRFNNRHVYKGKENSLADHGVRKYDDEIGRFTSIGPLWEKYYLWSPYHYCSLGFNNTMIFI